MKKLVWPTLSLIVTGCSAAVSASPAGPASPTPPPAAAAPTPTLATSSSPPPKTPPPNPCATDQAFQQFDFWVGEWEVFDLKGTKQGENRITKTENGCLLIERWTSARGNTGQSYNFYDPVTGKWRQVWVSQGMSIDYEGGLNAAGAMVLEGEIHYHNRRAFPFRGTWSRQADGSVRQHFDQFDPATKKWTAWFTGIYRSK